MKDEASNPEKFNEAKAEYKEGDPQIHRQDAGKHPGNRWRSDRNQPVHKMGAAETDQRRRLEKRTLEVAQTRYLVAQTDTNLDGRGIFAGLAPGSYWIGMLGMQAVSGDVRLRWDFPVTVRPGETAHVRVVRNLTPSKPFRRRKIQIH